MANVVRSGRREMHRPADLVPAVRAASGKVFANSRDVAAFFGKRHDHVLRDIRAIVATDPDTLPSFGEGSYALPETGPQKHPFFDMDRTGFALLAMGFTGAKALHWKRLYIEAFDRMEAELRARPATIDLNDPAFLRRTLLSYTEKVIALQGEVERIAVEKAAAERARLAAECQVAAVRPKVEFYDRYSDADGLFCLRNAARVLRQPVQGFIDRLKERGYLFYEGGALVARQKFRDRGLFLIQTRVIAKKARQQTFVTPLGLQYFARKLSVALDPLIFATARPSRGKGSLPV